MRSWRTDPRSEARARRRASGGLPEMVRDVRCRGGWQPPAWLQEGALPAPPTPDPSEPPPPAPLYPNPRPLVEKVARASRL